MNIFYVSEANTGCSRWRAEIPAKYLRKRGHTVHFFGQDRITTCPDAIVFGRMYKDGAELLKLYKWAKEKHVPIIYDTDDAVDLADAWNPVCTTREHVNDALYMAANADIVTTTTPALAQHLRKWNPNVVVIPNSIDPEEWAPEAKAPGAEVRVGWLGGSTHFLDVAIVLDAIAELKKKIKFTFVIYGMTTLPSIKEAYQANLKAEGNAFRTSPLGRAIKVFLKKSDGLQYEFVPFVPASQYVRTLCDLRLDIGIAPLAETPFNRHKSCIKFYEYAMSGAVTLASNVIPYSTEVPDTCDNTRKAWVEAIAGLIESDSAGRLKSQREWVMTHRNIQNNVVMWEQVLSSPCVSEFQPRGGVRV
ncbi:MAG TPA: hypothetical protein VE422_04740 [Terriglobia bacterium]|nr:hypothetical protein [Terriglobia bacterium]